MLDNEQHLHLLKLLATARNVLAVMYFDVLIAILLYFKTNSALLCNQSKLPFGEKEYATQKSVYLQNLLRLNAF